MEVLQIEEQIRTKTIPMLDLDFLKHKVRSNIHHIFDRIQNKSKASFTDSYSLMKITKNFLLTNTINYHKLPVSLQKEESDEKEPIKTREPKKFVTAQVPQTMPGHTGYLTFATLPPKFVR